MEQVNGTMEHLKQILSATLSSDQQALQTALTQLENAANSNFIGFVVALSDLLANVKTDSHVRQAAGIQLKNGLVAKDASVKAAYHQRWAAIDEASRQQIKNNVYETLGTETSRPSSAAQCIAAIASAELPHGMWENLMNDLCEKCLKEDATDATKEATLETIGYICQDIDADLLESYSAVILRALVMHMGEKNGEKEMNNNIRLCATTAFLNSLEFIRGNFAKSDDRNFIMTVTCQATQCADTRVKVVAMQCLVKIVSLYYEYMESYMGPALFAITVEAMKSEEDEVKLQGIEFWSSVCDEEIDLAMEAAEANENGSTPQQVSQHYTKGALQHLAPILLECLKQQDEHDDDDDWTPHKASGVCLMLLASCCGNDILLPVSPFLAANIKSPEWQSREAAVMAFGSILEGPDVEKLKPYVEEGMPVLLELMKDSNMLVRDTVAWTLSRICDQVPQAALSSKFIESLLNSLLENLDSIPRVATNVCWALSSLSDAAYENAEPTSADDDEPTTFALSEKFQLIVSKIIIAGERNDANLNNLRSSAYEALMELIKNAPKDQYDVVRAVHMQILAKVATVLEHAHTVDIAQANDFKSLLCAALQASLRKLSKEDAIATSSGTMEVLVKMLQQTGTGGVQEDALMAVGTLIECIGDAFKGYVQAFTPYLKLGLQATAEPQVCISAIGVVGDLCRAIGKDMGEISDDIMKVFITNIVDQNVNRMIKPHIISAFGDLALSIGPNFHTYASAVVLNALQQASSMQVDKNDYDMVDYLNELRDSCLEAYTGIIQGLKGDDEKNVCKEVDVVRPYLEHIVKFIEIIAQDQERTDNLVGASCGLLGDVCSAFGCETACAIDCPVFHELLQEGRRSKNAKTKTLSVWASKTIRNLKK